MKGLCIRTNQHKSKEHKAKKKYKKRDQNKKKTKKHPFQKLKSHFSQIASLTEAITANLALHSKHNNDTAVFLSHLSLDGFTEAELQFTKALDEFGQKLFFSGTLRFILFLTSTSTF